MRSLRREGAGTGLGGKSPAGSAGPRTEGMEATGLTDPVILALAVRTTETRQRPLVDFMGEGYNSRADSSPEKASTVLTSLQPLPEPESPLSLCQL